MTARTSTPKRRGPKPGLPRVGGKPKGYIFPETIKKNEGKARLRELVLAQLDPIVHGLIGKAIGVNHMMLRDEEKGQFRRLTELADIERALNAPNAAAGSTYWIHTRDPDVSAAADLLNRSIGKPIEEVQIEHSGEVGLADVLRRRKGFLAAGKD